MFVVSLVPGNETSYWSYSSIPYLSPTFPWISHRKLKRCCCARSLQICFPNTIKMCTNVITFIQYPSLAWRLLQTVTPSISSAPIDPNVSCTLLGLISYKKFAIALMERDNLGFYRIEIRVCRKILSTNLKQPTLLGTRISW